MNEKIKENNLSKKIISLFFLILYALLNLILMLHHEPWRDEIHAWLMAKELSIPELMKASRFDGHPILWHLILMPFAKLDFPIITLNIISYIIVLISSYLFLFKTKASLGFKLFCLFTIPFTYTYNSISRNYCLVLFFLICIAILYPQRQNKPILYSLLICFLIHTHSLAWGIVAGLTLTFHFYEIFLYKKRKNTIPLRKILFGLSLIIINTLLVVFELYGTSNTDYRCSISPYLIHTILLMTFILITVLLYTVLILKSNYKEFIILFCSLLFQCIIYLSFYSAVSFQRYILILATLLFYLLLTFHTETVSSKTTRYKYIYLYSIFLFFGISFGLPRLLPYIITDYYKPYSSAQEMASYINENIPKNTSILIDASIIGQSIIPYLEEGYQLYDITYQQFVDCANVSHDREKIKTALTTIKQFSGNYIIICNDFVTLEDCQFLYETSIPMTNEFFTIYYIP